MSALYASNMRNFAHEQVADGYALAGQHQPNDGGICRGCGRESPCSELERGAAMVATYNAWLAANPEKKPTPRQPEPDPRGALVRPFTTTAGRPPFATNVGPW